MVMVQVRGGEGAMEGGTSAQLVDCSVLYTGSLPPVQKT